MLGSLAALPTYRAGAAPVSASAAPAVRSEPCIIGIDQGTTSSRALAISESGQVLAQHALEFKQHYPNPGWCEHDPMEILDTVEKCVKAVLAKVGPGNVKAVGITNQRETTVAWDKNTGK